MAIALAAHGALVMVAPLIVPYLAPVEHTQPKLQLGAGAPFEGSGAGGAVALGTEMPMLPAFIPPSVPVDHPDVACDLTVPPSAEAVPTPPTPSLDLSKSTESAEDQPDPFARPTIPLSAPVTPPISLSAIVPDEPRGESIENARAASSTRHTVATGEQAISPSSASAPMPPPAPAQGLETGAKAPAIPDARSDSGNSKGDGGGRPGDPKGVALDISWVRIRPAARIADAGEYARDAKLPLEEQVWRGMVELRIDVNSRGRIYNVRIEKSSGNRKLDESAAKDIADNLPPKWLWDTADNRIPIIFKH